VFLKQIVVLHSSADFTQYWFTWV